MLSVNKKSKEPFSAQHMPSDHIWLVENNICNKPSVVHFAILDLNLNRVRQRQHGRTCLGTWFKFRFSIAKCTTEGLLQMLFSTNHIWSGPQGTTYPKMAP